MYNARIQNVLQPVTTIKVAARLSWSRPGIAFGFGFDVCRVSVCACLCCWLCVTFFGTLKDLPPASWLRCLFVLLLLLLLPGAVGHCNNCSCTFTICTWRVCMCVCVCVVVVWFSAVRLFGPDKNERRKCEYKFYHI